MVEAPFFPWTRPNYTTTHSILRAAGLRPCRSTQRVGGEGRSSGMVTSSRIRPNMAGKSSWKMELYSGTLTARGYIETYHHAMGGYHEPWACHILLYYRNMSNDNNDMWYNITWKVVRRHRVVDELLQPSQVDAWHPNGLMGGHGQTSTGTLLYSLLLGRGNHPWNVLKRLHLPSGDFLFFPNHHLGRCGFGKLQQLSGRKQY